MYCRYCGKEVPEGVKFCSECGKPTIYASEAFDTAQQNEQPVYWKPQNTRPDAIYKFAAASFILSISAGIFVFGWIGASILGILAVIFSHASKKKNNRVLKIAKVGKVIGIIDIIWGSWFWIWIVADFMSCL